MLEDDCRQLSVLPIPALHHAVRGTWRAVLGADWGRGHVWGREHEAAVVVMINMTVFEVMVGRWVVNLEQEEKDTVVFLVGPRQKAYQNLGVGWL